VKDKVDGFLVSARRKSYYTWISGVPSRPENLSPDYGNGTEAQEPSWLTQCSRRPDDRRCVGWCGAGMRARSWPNRKLWRPRRPNRPGTSGNVEDINTGLYQSILRTGTIIVGLTRLRDRQVWSPEYRCHRERGATILCRLSLCGSSDKLSLLPARHQNKFEGIKLL
jgi:hypothetical protein